METKRGVGITLFVAGLCLIAYLLHLGFRTKPNTPQMRSSYPVEAYATQDSGFLLLHFTVEGVDRVFMIHSGLAYSSFDSSRWPKLAKAKTPVIVAFSGGLMLGAVAPEDAKGSPMYDIASVHPDGILGQDFLKQVVLFFDPRQHKALLWPATDTDASAVVKSLFNPPPDWPIEGFKDSSPQPWLVTKTSFDLNSRLFVDMKVGDAVLESMLNTGDSSTQVAPGRFADLEHWDSSGVLAMFNGKPAADMFYLVHDVELPFAKLPVAEVAELADDDVAEAWIGLDMINRGRWMMDASHHLFAFQEYAKRTPTEILLSQGGLLLNPDGTVSWADSQQNSDVSDVLAINGRPPFETLVGFSRQQTGKEMAQSLARAIENLTSKPFEVTLLKDGQKVTSNFSPFVKGNLPTLAELVAKGQ